MYAVKQPLASICLLLHFAGPKATSAICIVCIAGDATYVCTLSCCTVCW